MSNDMIAAVETHLRVQQRTLDVLLKDMKTSLTDMSTAVESGQANGVNMKDLLSSVESALADVSSGIESVAKAMREMNPTVTVNVPQQVAPPINVKAVLPAQPAPVIHIMPAADQKGATWEMRIPGVGYNAADRVIKITRTN